MSVANSGLLLRLVSASCVAARNAGQIIRDVMSKGQLGIVDKGDPRLKDLQTEADRSAQKLIVRRLFRVSIEIMTEYFIFWLHDGILFWFALQFVF